MTGIVPQHWSIAGVVFDGDDTLWITERLYDDARAHARRIVENEGLNGEEWEKRERQLDVENVAKFGFSAQRFPTSCAKAYDDLCLNAGLAPNAKTREKIRNVARNVFRRRPTLVPDAKEALAFLRKKGVRLALLTKGDDEVQSRRVAQSGLAKLFDLVRIVPEKSPATILEVVSALGVEVSSAWMVGNSMKSDIIPAMEAGLKAIWIPAHVWEHERVSDNDIRYKPITATGLADVRNLVAPHEPA